MTNDQTNVPSSLAAEVASGLGEVLDSVRRDELTCAPQLRHRIEGARVALLQLGDQCTENDRMQDT